MLESIDDGDLPTNVANLVQQQVVARINSAYGSAESVACAVESEATSLAAELKTLKTAAKSAKAEIADWKAWWDGLHPDHSAGEIPKRQREVARLAAHLSDIEAQIAALIQRSAILAGVRIILRARADAIATQGPQADDLVLKHLRAAVEASKKLATPKPRTRSKKGGALPAGGPAASSTRAGARSGKAKKRS